MPQKFIKITLSVFVLFGIVYAFNFENINKITQGVFASNPPAVVDIKLKVLSDGTNAPQAFDATPNDSSALTDPGDDQNANNSVVRGGDTVAYQIQISAINMNTTDTTSVTTLDNGRWLSLPSVCLTTLTTPATTSALASSISSDGRTLTCNTGIVVEGTATYVNAVARADNAANNTPLNISGSASSNGSAVKPALPVGIVITGRPSVDLVKYVDSYMSGVNTIYEPAYIREQCNNAGVLTPTTTGSCATGVYGDVIIYKFKFQHSRLGDEKLASPFNVTVDDTFNYGAGNLGVNNASLLGCGVVSGYTASSGTIACGAPSSAGLTKSTVITLTGLDDGQTGTDGIIGNYYMKYFVPRSDFLVVGVVTTLNTSNLVTARSSSGAAANEAGWDPLSATGVSNYGAGTEKNSTCNVDPGSGNENSVTCDNRVALPLTNIPPGYYCADKIDTSIAAICSTGYKSTQSEFVSPNQIVGDVHIGFDSHLNVSNSGKVCSVVTTDASGNSLYNFTGNLAESSYSGIGTWQQRSKNYAVSFSPPDLSRAYRISKNDDGSITTSYYAPTVTGDNNYHDFSGYLADIPASVITDMTNTFNSVVIEFSTDSVPANSKNSFECDTGTWKTYSGDGSIQAQVGGSPITKVRAYVKNFTKSPDILYYGLMLFPEVKISGNAAVLAANGNVVQNYAATKAFDANGNQINTIAGVGQNGPNGWTIANGGPFSTPGEKTTFKGAPMQDLMEVKPQIIRIAKSNDKPVAVAGDIINYTLTPTYYGGGSSNLTITDTLPNGLTYVAGSYPSICSVAAQVLTCVYNNAVAGTTLNPATITYQAKVNINATNGDFANYVQISSSNTQTNADSFCTTNDPASAGGTQCQASALVQVRTPGAYYIEKRLISPQVDEVDQDLKYDLAIKNLGSQTLGQQEYI